MTTLRVDTNEEALERQPKLYMVWRLEFTSALARTSDFQSIK